MKDADVLMAFRALTEPLQTELKQVTPPEMREIFQPDPRPMPDGLIVDGLPLGHIAFMGDFAPNPLSHDQFPTSLKICVTY